MAVSPPICDFGWKPPDFSLPATDGTQYDLARISGSRGMLIMFICNHCPYVQSVLDRIIRDVRDLQSLGIGCAAICANDADEYPEDGFESMTTLALEKAFPFPYLRDEDQTVAKAWGAVCTPDFFGFNAHHSLQYRGRLDASGRHAAPDARRDLFEAMREISETGVGPAQQIASMGCSIKWKAA